MLASILISPCWPGWENTSAEVSGRPWKSHLAPHFMIVHFVLPPPLMIVHVEFCRIWWSSTLSFASFDNRPPCFAASFDHHPCYFGCWVRWAPSSKSDCGFGQNCVTGHFCNLISTQVSTLRAGRDVELDWNLIRMWNSCCRDVSATLSSPSFHPISY